jgi:flagellar basal-body rod protein FlgB
MALTGGDGASGPGGREMGYSVQSQPNLDGSTVDLDRERANFVDNAVRYEATLRFINGNAKTMLSAIQGQ